MIRNDNESRLTISLVVALVLHLVFLFFVKDKALESQILSLMKDEKSTPIKVDNIKVISPSEVERMRQVGIKDGAKNAFRPDIPKPMLPEPSAAGKKGQPKLSLGSLAPSPIVPPVPAPTPKTQAAKPTAPNPALTKTKTADSGQSHFYFNPKVQKVIPPSTEQEMLKEQAGRGMGPGNKATERISNFEIRYERPEGVSEDELNSDEKAYYSFYVRSYKNYFSKIYANYERIVLERPGLSRVFDSKHLLIGKIDYDEEGNIITVKIIKSSPNDDLHYFFEETLKQLNQPNPPRIFTKNRKQFSIYYQLQIN
jgi:hypothetical protein